jgi:hypothetical protein
MAFLLIIAGHETATTPDLAIRGHGIHHRVGAPLARLEARIALGRLLARFDDLSLAAGPDELRWPGSTLLHGLEALPVRVDVEAGAAAGARP